MRIKWQSCNWLLCYHQHLQKQEDSCTIIFQTTLVSVNFNAYIQKKRKRARYASFTLCFSASLNMDWQILLAPTRFFLKKKKTTPASSHQCLVTFPMMPYLWGLPLLKDLCFDRNQLQLTMFQKWSPISQEPVISVQILGKQSFIYKEKINSVEFRRWLKKYKHLLLLKYLHLRQ